MELDGSDFGSCAPSSRRGAPAATALAECFTRLSALFRSENFRDVRLELDTGRQLLRRRGGNRVSQFGDLLRVWCVRENRQLKLSLEVTDFAAWIVALCAALLGQRANLFTLSIRQIQFAQNRQWRSRPTSETTSAAGALWRLRNHWNRYSDRHGDRGDAGPYHSFHVEPPLHFIRQG
jgi:hypothetical protein